MKFYGRKILCREIRYNDVFPIEPNDYDHSLQYFIRLFYFGNPSLVVEWPPFIESSVQEFKEL